MKRPFTLLGRTTLALGVLMLLSQILWLSSAAYFLIRPIELAFKQQLSAVIMLAQSLIETRSRDGNPISSNEFALGPLENFKIVPDSDPRPEFNPSSDFMISNLIRTLQANFGPSIRIYKEKGKSVMWVRFSSQGKMFWAVFPKGAPPLPYYLLASTCIGISVSVLGAYIIIYKTTLSLRKITEAIRSVGRGKASVTLEEIGPREIRDLSRGFNQMTTDLQKLDQDRRLMLAGISHDLKTPLTHLRIAVELTETRAEPEIAAGMVHDIEDMDSILKQFLDYARDGTEEQPSIGDLNALVSDVCERYRMRGDVIKVSFGNVPAFPFRRLAMYRVITNLVDNAIRYGREGVQVETQLTDEVASVTVADNGPGIRSGSPNDFIKAFARENTSRSESGAGLGLTIVDRVVRTQGGKLYMENKSSGGLLVRIELPIRPSDDRFEGVAMEPSP